MLDLNIFVVVSAITAILSFTYIIYCWIKKPFSKANNNFIIFSFTILLISASNLIVLIVEDFNTAMAGAPFLYAGVLLSPIAQLFLIVDFIEFSYPIVMQKYRYFFYVIPAAIWIYLYFTGDLQVSKVAAGYMMSSSAMRIISPIYLTGLEIIILIILILEIYRRKKTGIFFLSVLLLLIGILTYILGQSLYQGFLMMGILNRVPSTAISLAALYIFILVSMFFIKIGIQDLSLQSVFKQIHDCIIITDNNGEILEANECMKQKLGFEKTEVLKRFTSGEIKASLSKMLNNSSSSEDFFNSLKDKSDNSFSHDIVFPVKDGSQTYNVLVSPIHDNRNKILGKIGIFRDISSIKRLEKDLSIKNEISNIFLTVPDNEMYGELLKILLKLFDSTYGIFGYINEDGDLVSPSLTRDVWNKCKVDNKSIVFPHKIWAGIWGKAIVERQSQYFNEVHKLPEGHMPICRAVATPIVYRGRSIGVLVVGNKPTDYTPEDIFTLEDIADFIAPVLYSRVKSDIEETKRLEYEKKIEYLSFHDKLTGLYNRRYFEEEIKRLDTPRQLPISIIMADINYLKKVNDAYGHKKGDRLIKRSAEILQNSCRKEDILARWGGDEFIIMLTNAGETETKEVIKRIEKAQVGKKINDEIQVSISLGFFTKTNKSQKIEKVIEKADKNMYENKIKMKEN